MQKLQKITLMLAAGLIGAYIGFNLGLDFIWLFLLPKSIPDTSIVLYGPDIDSIYSFDSNCLQDCGPAINLQIENGMGGAIKLDGNLTYSH